MRKYLFNFTKALLMGVAFAVVGCTDYDEDIKNVNDRIDQVIAGQIDPLKLDLEKAVADLTAAQAALETEIKAAHKEDVDALTAADAKLQAAVDEANAAIIALKDELNNKINGVEADLTEKINAAEEKIAEANTAIEELQADVEALNNKDEVLAKELADLKSELETLGTDLKALIAKNAEDIEALNKNFANHIATFTEFQATVNGKIAALEAKDKEIDAAIETINASIEELENTKLDKNDFENYKAETQKVIDSILASIEALEAADIELNDKIDAVQDGLQKQLDDATEMIFANASEIAKVKEDVKANATEITANTAAIEKVATELETAVNALNSKDTELEALIAALRTDVEENKTKIAALETKYAEMEKAFNEYKEYVAGELSAIKAKDADQDGRLQLSEDAIVELQKKDADIQAQIDAINEVIAAVKVDIKNLMNRVQSLVYIPTHSDGKATINYAIMKYNSTNEQGEAVENNIIIEAASELKYQVYPAECAQAIKSAWTLNNEALNFVLESVQVTRTENEADLNIVGVEADANGVLTLTVEARNLGDSFYNNETSWSTSLVLNYNIEGDATANLSSCYTNLAPQSEQKAALITAALFKGGKDITGSHDEKQEIEYTNRGNEELNIAKILEGHFVGYVLNGEAPVTWDAMAQKGYAITAPSFQYNVLAIDSTGTTAISLFDYFDYKNIYSPADAEATILEPNTEFEATALVQPIVRLTDKAIDVAVGTHLCYTVVYNAMGAELTASSDVYVAQDKATVTAAITDIVWNYDLDAAQDSLFYADAEYSYARTELPLEVINNELDNVDFNEIIGVATPIIKINGENNGAANGTVEINVNAEGNPVLNFTGFEWNKEYTIKAEYEIASVIATFEIKVKTIGRTNEPVVIKAADSVALYKNIKFNAFAENNPTEAMSLENIYTVLNEAYDLGTFAGKQTEFLNEVLVDNAYAAVANVEGKDDTQAIKKNITVKSGSYIDVNREEAKASIGFAYTTWNFVPTTVVYTKEMTLWYGQPVVLEYTVDFTMPEAGYNFMHNDLWVFVQGERYVSQVQGKYTASKTAIDLESFEVDNIDMDMAFNVVDKDGNVLLDNEELVAAGLTTEFSFVTEPKDAGIAMTDNVITYNGKDAEVYVNGKLFMNHDNGARIAIPTRFDNGEAYADYAVIKFDPLTDVTAHNGNIAITEVEKYEVKVLKYFDIFESRKGNNVATELNGMKIDLITEAGEWLIGDGANGWAADKTIQDMYGFLDKFVASYSDVDVKIPQQYKNAIKWNAEEGILTFDNTPNMLLKVPVEIEVTLNVDYTWAPVGGKKATAKITFYNPDTTTIE